MKNKIKSWKKLTDDLTCNFLEKYFELEDLQSEDYFWVADDVGGIFSYGDYYFNFSDALYCLENEVKVDRVFAWYDHCLENPNDNINLKYFSMDSEAMKEREEAYIRDLEFKVEMAKKEFEEAIKKYKNENN